MLDSHISDERLILIPETVSRTSIVNVHNIQKCPTKPNVNISSTNDIENFTDIHLVSNDLNLIPRIMLRLLRDLSNTRDRKLLTFPHDVVGILESFPDYLISRHSIITSRNAIYVSKHE